MYRRILLAYDGSVEGRAALREGALVAKRCRAQVFLLSVVIETGATRATEGMVGGVVFRDDSYAAVLNDGVERLKQLGFDPVAKLVRGEPAKEIGAFAHEVDADLVVVGHRRQGLFERWWSGPSGAYLVDRIHCSLLISRNVISDEAFRAAMANAAET